MRNVENESFKVTQVMTDLTAAAWEQKYQESQDAWDLGFPTPPLVNLLSSAQAPQPGRIAVLGCGTGQDALSFAAAGFDAVGFDFAASPIERATTNAKNRDLPAQFFQRDIFELEAGFFHDFDYVLEHTCFCAIDPTLRPKYVQVVKKLLRPQGQLIALFYTHSRSGGPPFGSQPQEILAAFTPYFDPILFQPASDSIDRRQGDEHLAIFQVR